MTKRSTDGASAAKARRAAKKRVRVAVLDSLVEIAALSRLYAAVIDGECLEPSRVEDAANALIEAGERTMGLAVRYGQLDEDDEGLLAEAIDFGIVYLWEEIGLLELLGGTSGCAA